MPKISELPRLTSITSTAVWPVLENNTVQQISFNSFKSAINTPASANLLGAVKIGQGISVNSEGQISVTIPTASSATIGGVKVATGSNLTVNGSAVLALSNDIMFGNNSRINATETDVLEIISNSVTVNSDSGTINLEITETEPGTGANITITPGFIQMTGQLDMRSPSTILLESGVGQIVIKSGNGYLSAESYSEETETFQNWLDIQPSNSEFTSGTFIGLIGDVRIGSFSDNTSSFRLPRYSATQRDLKTVKNNGELIYNITTNKVQAYANGAWVDLH
jgi:hypothetical protein